MPHPDLIVRVAAAHAAAREMHFPSEGERAANELLMMLEAAVGREFDTPAPAVSLEPEPKPEVPPPLEQLPDPPADLPQPATDTVATIDAGANPIAEAPAGAVADSKPGAATDLLADPA